MYLKFPCIMLGCQVSRDSDKNYGGSSRTKTDCPFD